MKYVADVFIAAPFVGAIIVMIMNLLGKDNVDDNY